MSSGVIYSSPMSMTMPMSSTMSSSEEPSVRSGSDPTSRILTRDEINYAVKAADANSRHHSIREYVEAGGVVLAGFGAGAFVLDARKRYKKAHKQAKAVKG
jgi:hypothetical protein